MGWVRRNKEMMMRVVWVLLTLIGLLFGAILIAFLIKLPRVDGPLTQAQASPPVLAAFGVDPPIETSAQWSARRAPLLRAAFAANVYGQMPPAGATRVVDTRAIEFSGLGGLGSLEEWTIETQAGAKPVRLHLALVLPNGKGPFPVIVMETFCGNRAAFKGATGLAKTAARTPSDCNNARMRPLIQTIFGAHIFNPPFEAVLRRGYALAMFHPGEVVADAAEAGLKDLEEISGQARNDPNRPGAIAAWAWAYSRVIDMLNQDGRLDPARQAVWGHSRNGKAALLAAAFDPDIDLVLALQPGTGGATLSRSRGGETVAQMTKAFPHWFSPAFGAFGDREADLPVDQHQLLALIAPRPILLGAARRDGWSDPKGALRAAQGASPVYALFGVTGLNQTGLNDPDLSANLAFYTRPGLHGVTRQDWANSLDFLDRHFAVPGVPAQAQAPAAQILLSGQTAN